VPTVDFNARTWQGLNCPAHLTEVTYWLKALPRFGLRCRRDRGTRTWVVLDGGNSRRPIGDARAIGFADAVKAARRQLSAIRLGVDPERRQKAAISLRELASHYLAHQQGRLKPRSYEELRRHLEVHAAPLHSRRINEVGQRDIVKLLQAVAAKAPTTANRVRSSLSAMFAWGMKAGLVLANPVSATFQPAVEQSRDRVLSDDELSWVWACTDDDSDYRRIVQILALTGQRRDEVAGMRESELVRHGDGTITWTIPGSRSKNGLPNDLLLPPMIATLIPAAPRKGRELLFGDGEKGFAGWSKSKRRLDAAIANAGHSMPHWVLHDLRRTFVTRLNDLGVAPYIIEAAVNHRSGVAKAGIAGVYNKSNYVPQKRAALALWCDHIAQIIAIARVDEGANAVALRRLC
jgi:integrase